MKRRNWNDIEISIIIQTYIWMQEEQAAGRPFNKAALARRIVPMLDERTKGSYEAKLMNVSAVMRDLARPIVKGYVPLGHAQKSLKEAVKTMIASRSRAA